MAAGACICAVCKSMVPNVCHIYTSTRRRANVPGTECRSPMPAYSMGPAGLMCNGRYARCSSHAVPFGGRRRSTMFTFGTRPLTLAAYDMTTWAFRPHDYVGYEFSKPLALGVSDPSISIISLNLWPMAFVTMTPICTFSFMRRSHPLRSFLLDVLYGV